MLTIGINPVEGPYAFGEKGERTPGVIMMIQRLRMTSGLEWLDSILSGLFIGDNVVWHDDAGSLAMPFCQMFLSASQEDQKPIIYASFDRGPKTVIDRLGSLAEYPALTLLDCFTMGKGGGSPVFMKFYEEEAARLACRVVRVERPAEVAAFSEVLYQTHETMTGDVRLVFESLTGMRDLWGGEEALVSFYTHACPRLYELETIAYWILEKRAHSPRFKASLSQIAQVVLDLSIKRGTTSLTVLKADDREATELHKAFPYWIRDRRIAAGAKGAAKTGLDLGLRLKEIRTRRGVSQSELARQVGVTPSTISQVESNLIHPSLPALLKMAEVLRVDMSSLLRAETKSRSSALFTGDDAATVRLAGLAPDQGRAWRLGPEDFPGKVRLYRIDMEPGATLTSHFLFHKGEECGVVLDGRVQVRLGGETLEAKAGETLYFLTETPDGWRNPGPETVRLLWLQIG
jgi:transcriptional regulator with XRE-family HTH domain